MTGDFVGEIHGAVSGAARRIGSGPTGVSDDLFLQLDQAGVSTHLMFSIFDADGVAGPKRLNALFGETRPEVAVGGWQDGRDPGRASLKDDGSHAEFDIAFDQINPGRHAHVSGTIDCPPLPGPGGRA